jgi:predicted flap endonuclease-1-like 5' DNA nuclease
MTPFVVLFVSVAAIAVGMIVGWMLRARMDAGASEDPEAELRVLREAHSDCATRIRNLHLELAQVETKLSMSRVETTSRSMTVSEDELAGAARLASLIDALEAGTESESGDDQTERPAAFMSILPADLVESQTVRESLPSPAPEETSPPIEATPPKPVPAVVVALVHSAEDEPVIQVDVRPPDDLTMIKGIGPKIAAILDAQGINSYRQLAELDDAQIEALGEALGSFRGRIHRDDWVGAAQRMIGEPANS